MLSVLEDFNLKNKTPVSVFAEPAIMAKSGNFTKRSKYVETHFHYVHDMYKKNVIDVIKIYSKDNVADILSKSLVLLTLKNCYIVKCRGRVLYIMVMALFAFVTFYKVRSLW